LTGLRWRCLLRLWCGRWRRRLVDGLSLRRGLIVLLTLRWCRLVDGLALRSGWVVLLTLRRRRLVDGLTLRSGWVVLLTLRRGWLVNGLTRRWCDALSVQPCRRSES
jgi:hypothetical protein